MGISKFVSRTRRVLAWSLVVSLAVLGASLFLLFGVLCGTSDALSRVRALDHAQLEMLHDTVRRLDREFGGAGARLSAEQIPHELAFLRANSVVLDGEMSRITVAGCVDDFVILWFHGVTSGPRRITLTPGEVRPREELWSESERLGR
jgi:hypothetical protein